tara:strand:- start:1503 stop:2624 length:1122 start_codon:yes stop_codon:yes gene_type:complete
MNLRKNIKKELRLLSEQTGRNKTNYSGTDGRSGVTLIPPSKSEKPKEIKDYLDDFVSGQDDVKKVTPKSLKEQGNTPCTNGAYMTLEACPNSYHWTGNYNAGPWHCYCCTIDGNAPTQADVGTTIDYGPLNSSMGPNSFTVLSVGPGQNSQWQGSMNSTSACCVPAVQTGQGGCITPPSNGIGVNGRYVVLNNCDCDPTTGVGCYNPSGVSNGATGGAWMAATICMTVDGGQVPQVGQTVDVPMSQNMTSGMVITQASTHPYCTADPGYGVNPGDPGTIGNFYDWSTMGPCPTTPPTTGCDQSAWSNYSNWVSNFTSLPNFSSSNPNQPCNMICNKIQTWTNNLTGAGPAQTNQLNCKIDEANNQSQIHGCNC